MARIKKVRDMEWQMPILNGYRMACCDCGLVHNVDFRVMRVVRAHKNGEYTLVVEPNKRLRIQMRASRNERSTAQVRRHKAKP